MEVFYVESPAMRQLQQKAGRGDYEHLVIHSSLIRPASQAWIHEYVRRLHGKPYDPWHPQLEEILQSSYGIMVYQEDVTRTAMAVAGFSSAEGDGLRKALSKKRPEQPLAAYQKQFFQGARKRGFPGHVIEKIWQMILSFVGYSFCKPHSASYALVSFQAAYLRRHYPAEFMAAVLSNGGGYYSTLAYLSEARRMGLKILAPELNHSEIHYVGQGRELRVGLMQVKGARRASLVKWLTERKLGHFTSLENFLKRVQPDYNEVKTLILSGCLDQVEPDLNRPQLLWKLEQLHQPAGQTGLGLAPQLWLPQVSDYSRHEKLRAELKHFGLLLSCHPLEVYAKSLTSRPHLSAQAMKQHVGERVTMIGWLITTKVVLTRDQQVMEFVSFEDLTGTFETVFFPQAYQKYALQLNPNQPFILKGKIQSEFGVPSLEVDSLQPVTPAAATDFALVTR